jgi:hypothetical protein
MRRVLLIFLMLATGLVFSVSPALADKKVTIKPIDHPAPGIISLGERTGPACVVGNTHPPYWAIGDFLLPPENYKLSFNPLQGDCPASCPPPTWWGFKTTTIHIILQVAEPCTLTLAVDIEEATYSGGLDCPEPSIPACGTNLLQVVLTSSGMWDIGLPIDCDCLSLHRKYLIGFYIDSYSNAGGTVPSLVTDAGPATLCTNYNNYGSGWMDLTSAYPSWPGNLVFFAEAECCELPVPTEEKSWGFIKKLYEK